MKKNLKGWALAGAVLFGVVAAVAGFYYAPEIKVVSRYYWFSLFPGVEVVRPTATIATPEEATSSLHLQTVPESIPLVFSDTLEEEKLQEYLKEGAVVLPLGPTFGESGNVVVTAHSSGTQSFGPYRFAFSKLAELQEGDEFFIHIPNKTYTYKVYKKEIVWPTQVDHLPQDDRSTVTLVTCWPLWTNFKRLLVHSELVKTEDSLH